MRFSEASTPHMVRIILCMSFFKFVMWIQAIPLLPEFQGARLVLLEGNSLCSPNPCFAALTQPLHLTHCGCLCHLAAHLCHTLHDKWWEYHYSPAHSEHANIQQTMVYAHFAPDYLQDAVMLNPLREKLEMA